MLIDLILYSHLNARIKRKFNLSTQSEFGNQKKIRFELFIINKQCQAAKFCENNQINDSFVVNIEAKRQV